jgi:hypothetical protein
MHYCQWERRCSVGWAQNDTLRFFGPNSGDGPCWGSRAFDYGAYLKKRGLALPESYNYNPFDLIRMAVGPGDCRRLRIHSEPRRWEGAIQQNLTS